MADTYKTTPPPDTFVKRIKAIPVGKSLLLRNAKAKSIRTIVSRLRVGKSEYRTAKVAGGVMVWRTA